jgi:hypothetical protein
MLKSWGYVLCVIMYFITQECKAGEGTAVIQSLHINTWIFFSLSSTRRNRCYYVFDDEPDAAASKTPRRARLRFWRTGNSVSPGSVGTSLGISAVSYNFRGILNCFSPRFRYEKNAHGTSRSKMYCWATKSETAWDDGLDPDVVQPQHQQQIVLISYSRGNHDSSNWYTVLDINAE